MHICTLHAARHAIQNVQPYSLPCRWALGQKCVHGKWRDPGMGCFNVLFDHVSFFHLAVKLIYSCRLEAELQRRTDGMQAAPGALGQCWSPCTPAVAMRDFSRRPKTKCTITTTWSPLCWALAEDHGQADVQSCCWDGTWLRIGLHVSVSPINCL